MRRDRRDHLDVPSLIETRPCCSAGGPHPDPRCEDKKHGRRDAERIRRSYGDRNTGGHRPNDQDPAAALGGQGREAVSVDAHVSPWVSRTAAVAVSVALMRTILGAVMIAAVMAAGAVVAGC